MKPYELTYVLSSAATADESERAKADIESFIQQDGGVIVKSAKSAAKSLAYPVKKNHSGYVVSLEFQADPLKVKSLKEKLDQEKNVLRAMVVVVRPVRENRKIRTKKPFGHIAPAGAQDQAKKKDIKVDMENIDQKLDQMLTE
jgi:ribosomal protein S6